MYRILYIEDEVDMLEDLPPVLAKWGLDVVGTSSFEEAHRLLSQGAFDAVLVDICMPPSPDMDPQKVQFGRETGIEVARRLRSANDKIPIMALTVVNDEEIMSRMRQAGICHILNKPQEPRAVAEALLIHVRDR